MVFCPDKKKKKKKLRMHEHVLNTVALLITLIAPYLIDD